MTPMEFPDIHRSSFLPAIAEAKADIVHHYSTKMFSYLPHRPTVLMLSLSFLFAHQIFAQKAGLEVTRTTAMDRAQPVLNIAVDAEGRKWAANSKGVFQIKAADLSTPRSMAAGERNVLEFRGGNADFAFSEAAFKKIADAPCSITAAWYDAANTTLWLGTDEAGLFQLKTQPQLALVQQYKPANSKLKSNNITLIYQDRLSRLWVGTDQGLMYGPPGRWKADFANYAIQRVREYNTVIYVLADGEISKAPNGDKWSDLAVDTKQIEGEINDFDIDPEGKMWIVSGVLTRLDLLASTYDVFSGPEYYTSQYGSCVAVTAEGAAWVGTDDKGLYMVDKAYSMTLNAYVEQPISCEGNGKDAVLLAKVTGGVPPYTYAWSGGLSGEKPTNVGAGTYSITVTDSKGKARTAEVPVFDVRLKIKARQKKPESGPGKGDGSAEVDIATNASGIQIKWDNGEVMAVASHLTTGQHTVTVTDPKGCAVTATVTIGEKAIPLSVSISEKTAVKCAGEKTAALSAAASGGKAPYKFAWSNPALTGESPSGAAAGEYSLTVTDAAGATATAAIGIKQPEPLSVTATATAPASTGQADGKAMAQAKGGTGVYLFKWDDGETTYNAAKLAVGQRSVTVTDANGCTATATVSISENILPLAVRVLEKTALKCAGDKNAVLVAQVNGGKAPFKYVWSNAAGSSDQATNLGSGNYQVTVTDFAGSTATAVFTLKQPDALSVTATATAPASAGKADGKATATPAPFSANYTYRWDNGEIEAAATKLASGTRSVTVTDGRGCTATAQVSVQGKIEPISLTMQTTVPIKCAGEKTYLLILLDGGKTPYQSTKYSANVNKPEEGVGPGEYSVTVVDGNGTTASASVTVKEPAKIALGLAVTAPASTGNADGKATATPTGGTGDFTYKWDNGETAATAVKLGPGQRSLTVTDANGCTATATVSISENILPLAVAVSEKTKIKCAGEKTAVLAAQVSGGKAPFKFSWSNPALTGDSPANVAAGDFQLTVTDATGKTTSTAVSVKQPEPLTISAVATAPASTGNTDGKATATPAGGAGGYIFQWDSGESGASVSKLGPGQRSVTVTDANGCIAVATVSISENILQLAVVIAERSKIKCAGEKAVLAAQVTGGKAPFKFSWSNPALTGDSPSDVPGGDFQLTITDATGKTSTASTTVAEPKPIAITATVQQAASTGNADGKATAEAAGGAGGYKFKWDNGEAAALATKLSPGKHTATVMDANGCSASVEVTISENILALEVAIAERSKIMCAGEKASLSVTPRGGKPPYSFAWNNPVASGDAPSDLDGGDYSVTVTDAKGTTQTASISVKVPEPLVVELARNLGATSATSSDGKAQVSIKGGTPKFTVAWDTKQSGLSVAKLPLGPHSVTVTDANGCSQKIDFQTEKRVLPELTGVIEDGQTIRMKLLNFDTDSDVVREESLPMLDELYDFMTEHPVVSIEIGGHTNNQPTDEFADKLSTARAKSVADYLFAKGVDPKRVVFKGYGKRQPIAANTSAEGRKTNQRVEIKILRTK